MSETSLNFTWNEYHQHCNNDSIVVEYEYELLRSSDSTLIYGGKETNTFISFNNLESGTGYNLQVRVYVTGTLTDTGRFGSWSFTQEMTISAPGMFQIFLYCHLAFNFLVEESFNENTKQCAVIFICRPW